MLERQEVVLTVPASFDDVARELTLERPPAGRLTANVTLLEEPQAAFYAWIDATTAWREGPRPPAPDPRLSTSAAAPPTSP